MKKIIRRIIYIPLVIPRPAQHLYILLLTECHYKMTIKMNNARWQLYENVLSGNVFMLLVCKASCFNCIVCNCTNPIWQGSSCFYSLGVTKYPWEIVGVDLVIGFIKISKLRFAKNFDSRLPFDKDGTLLFVS